MGGQSHFSNVQFADNPEPRCPCVLVLDVCLPRTPSGGNDLNGSAFGGYGRRRAEPAFGRSRDGEVLVPDTAGARPREPGPAPAGRGPDPNQPWATAADRSVGPGLLGHVQAVGRVERCLGDRRARDRSPLPPGGVQALLEALEHTSDRHVGAN
jgi:hypothetical protein